jgi:hypothetical protein
MVSSGGPELVVAFVGVAAARPRIAPREYGCQSSAPIC